MNKYETEVLRMSGEKVLAVAKKEFEGDFEIIARTDEMFVLGDRKKNVKFSRSRGSIVERFFFDASRVISRKGIL